MADSGLFIGFGLPVRGRERQAIRVFNEVFEYYSRLQEQGEIESFEPVLLEPHGGDLGGFRKLPPDSPDVALANTSFRAYAAHMRTADFGAAIADLVTDVAAQPTAVMCSESVWWRCHRRLIADHACLIERLEVRHLMPDGRLVDHKLTAGVRVSGNDLLYDRRPEAEPLPFADSDSPSSPGQRLTRLKPRGRRWTGGSRRVAAPSAHRTRRRPAA